MTSQTEKKPAPAENRESDSTLAIFASMADTTWRMFVPPAILVPLGIWTDLTYHTKPWVTVITAIIGLALAVLLVKKQLGAIR